MAVKLEDALRGQQAPKIGGGPLGGLVSSLTGGGLSGLVKPSDKFSPRKYQKEQLEADATTLATNPDALGLTEAQRRQMVSEATEASNVQRQAESSDLARTALAGQGFQQGAFVDAQREVAAGAAADTAEASNAAGKLHQAMIDQEKLRIHGDIEAARARAAENTKFWAEFGLDAAETVGDVLSAAGVF